MSLNAHFSQRLRKKIEEIRGRKIDGMASGGLTSFEDYKRDTGYLKALDDVAAWCEQIESDLNEGK